jgi:hypothetical protein
MPHLYHCVMSGGLKPVLHESISLSHSSHNTLTAAVWTRSQPKHAVRRTAHCPTDEMTAVGTVWTTGSTHLCAWHCRESHRWLGLDNRGNRGSIPSTRNTFFYSSKRPDQLWVAPRFPIHTDCDPFLWGKMVGAWGSLHNSV